MYISNYAYVTDTEMRENITYLGMEEFDSVECYKLKFTPPDGAEETLFINADNYILNVQLSILLFRKILELLALQ